MLTVRDGLRFLQERFDVEFPLTQAVLIQRCGIVSASKIASIFMYNIFPHYKSILRIISRELHLESSSHSRMTQIPPIPPLSSTVPGRLHILEPISSPLHHTCICASESMRFSTARHSGVRKESDLPSGAGELSQFMPKGIGETELSHMESSQCRINI